MGWFCLVHGDGGAHIIICWQRVGVKQWRSWALVVRNTAEVEDTVSGEVYVDVDLSGGEV